MKKGHFPLFYKYLLVIVVAGVRAEWLTDMVKLCGDTVNDLFYGALDTDGTLKCRLMRAARGCIENNTSPSDWEFMVNTSQIATVDAKINATCEGESLSQCPDYAVQTKMRGCHHGEPPTRWTCARIKHSQAILKGIIKCMKEALTQCPDDEFIAADLIAMDKWTEEAANCRLPESTSTEMSTTETRYPDETQYPVETHLSARCTGDRTSRTY